MKGLPRQTTRLFVVRHGQTADNVEMRYLGRRDEPLTATGRKQADQTAAALSAFPIQAVYTSPLIRTADTAARIQERCRTVLIKDSRLVEGSFGRWEGLRRDEVIQSGGPDAELLLEWEADASCAPPGGESLKDVQARVVDFLTEVEREWSGRAIALVSHVGPIKALLAYAMGIPLLATRRLFLDPCSVSVVDLGERPFVRLFNSHAHLGWESPRWAVLPGN